MRRIERPLGVYIIAIYDFLVVGVIPLFTFVLALRNSEAEFPFILVLMSVAMYFAVMGAAVWVCVSGDNIGRWVLLGIVTVVALQWIVNALLMLAGSDVGGAKFRLIGFIPRGSIALALNWWYFNRQSTVAYYKQNS